MLCTSKCKALLKEWQKSMPTFTLSGDRLGVDSRYKYLGSLITPSGVAGFEVASRTAKTEAFTNVTFVAPK